MDIKEISQDVFAPRVTEPEKTGLFPKKSIFVFWGWGSNPWSENYAKKTTRTDHEVHVLAKFGRNRTGSFPGKGGQSPDFGAPWRSRDCHVTGNFFCKRSRTFLANITSEGMSIGAVLRAEKAFFRFHCHLEQYILVDLVTTPPHRNRYKFPRKTESFWILLYTRRVRSRYLSV